MHIASKSNGTFGKVRRCRVSSVESQIRKAAVNILGHDLAAGDGVSDESAVTAQALVPSEVLIFDLL